MVTINDERVIKQILKASDKLAEFGIRAEVSNIVLYDVIQFFKTTSCTQTIFINTKLSNCSEESLLADGWIYQYNDLGLAKYTRTYTTTQELHTYQLDSFSNTYKAIKKLWSTYINICNRDNIYPEIRVPENFFTVLCLVYTGMVDKIFN